MTTNFNASEQMTDAFANKTNSFSLSQKQKLALATGAILLTGGAIFIAATPDNNKKTLMEIDEVLHPALEAGHVYNVGSGTIKPNEDVAIAHSVNDAMSFREASLAAREEVGVGGLFLWHGHIYGTFTQEEWQHMPLEQRQDFLNDLNYEPTHEEVVANTSLNDPNVQNHANEVLTQPTIAEGDSGQNEEDKAEARHEDNVDDDHVNTDNQAEETETPTDVVENKVEENQNTPKVEIIAPPSAEQNTENAPQVEIIEDKDSKNAQSGMPEAENQQEEELPVADAETKPSNQMPAYVETQVDGLPAFAFDTNGDGKADLILVKKADNTLYCLTDSDANGVLDTWISIDSDGKPLDDTVEIIHEPFELEIKHETQHDEIDATPQTDASQCDDTTDDCDNNDNEEDAHIQDDYDHAASQHNDDYDNMVDISDWA